MITSVTQRKRDSAPRSFWISIADELFENVFALHEPVNTFVSNRSPHEGFSATLVVCPRLASRAQPNLSRTLEILEDLQNAWPLASRWLTVLRSSAASISTSLPTASCFSPGPVLSHPGFTNSHSNDNLPEHDLTTNKPGIGSLEMLSEAAVSAERNGSDDSSRITGSKNRGNNSNLNRNRVIDEFLTFSVPETVLNPLNRYPGINTDNGASFDKELTEFMNQPSYGMIDIWIPSEQDAWLSSGEP
ncbi:hypothetical protein TSTA_061080 [Talaromyces stipitatus ATCC 10500]|uniref:Uncharacterized protein n=1 Tax=Talaromyces stipitatus (strain ATCC 10500 / CBS 375.48 / QM 6759 / NRRL 1006) TaxID=441959 RepID=B8LUZ6_TALSN|nr:uncharacterized protein TSTA_061080 [Talaromyces stipitatus ATCC 10500]EED22617.1 hypothetical protein TSTA_061080 [Talaromyces stipitatus ATCC 10500]